MYMIEPLRGRECWGVNPFTLVTDHEQGLREMCDFGAAEVARGRYDAIEFGVMGGEVPYIRAYMARKHPTVKYIFNAIGGIPK